MSFVAEADPRTVFEATSKVALIIEFVKWFATLEKIIISGEVPSKISQHNLKISTDFAHRRPVSPLRARNAKLNKLTPHMEDRQTW